MASGGFQNADTELGRAATAFDGMLDALETSEHRAQHSAAAARRAEAATRQFLADAAHELRTPIAGIHAAAEQVLRAALQDGVTAPTDSQQRRAALVLNESRRAGKRVADMLDLTRIDSGLTLDLTQADLAAIADAECERAALLSPDLAITRSGEPHLPVYADPARLTQILANLVTTLAGTHRRANASPSTSATLLSPVTVARSATRNSP